MLRIDQIAMIQRIAGRLRALGDPHRIRLLLALKDGAQPVGALADALGIAQPSASKHLAVLAAAGLVAARRDGTHMRYRISDPEVFELCAVVCKGVLRHIAKQQAALAAAQGLQRRKGRVA